MKRLFFLMRATICALVLMFEVSAESFMDSVSSKLKKAKEAAKEKVLKAQEKISSELEEAKEQVKTKTQEVREDVTTGLSDAKNTIEQKVEQVQQRVLSEADEAKKIVEENLEKAHKKISSEFEEAKNEAKENTQEIRQEVASKTQEAKAELGGASAKASGAVSQLKEKVKNSGRKAQSRIKEAREEFSGKISEAKKNAEEFLEKTKNSFAEVLKASRTMFTKEPKRNFCSVDPTRTYAPTIDDSRVIEQDTEQMIPVIKKYSPILYLFNERYYPVAAEDYFLNPTTQLVYAENKEAKPQIVIPAGEITMQKIYENRTKYSGRWYYFDISGCTKYGSNPEKFSDKDGNLTTPIYVNWSKQGEKIYIAYVFAYAFNGAYPIAAPVADVRMFQEGAHEFDLEHIVLELDATSKKLENIFFAAHSRKEGVWLPADHQDIRYEGTHPVVHVAKNGHGSYPRAGTHVRILGFANDITSRDYKAHRWVPQIVLIYPDTDKRFDPATVGWVYHSGVYGRRGVDSFKRFIGTNAQGKGMPYKKVQFCPNPQNPKDLRQWAKYRLCVEKKRINAKIPK